MKATQEQINQLQNLLVGYTNGPIFKRFEDSENYICEKGIGLGVYEVIEISEKLKNSNWVFNCISAGDTRNIELSFRIKS